MYVATAPPEDPQPSPRVVEQRIRNRVIEYLELASSFDDQLQYQRNVEWVHIPVEIIEQWADSVRGDPRTDSQPLSVYSADELHVMGDFHATWDRVADRTPYGDLSITDLQQLPEWDELRQAAISALAVFQQRGRMPEDREI